MPCGQQILRSLTVLTVTVFVNNAPAGAATSLYRAFEFNVDGELPSETYPEVKFVTNTSTQVAEQHVYSVQNGLLLQQTSDSHLGSAGWADYAYPNASVDGGSLSTAKSYTMEARLRIREIQAQDWGAYFGLHDGIYGYQILFDQDSALTGSAAGITQIQVNDIFAWHTYRFTKSPDSNQYDIYVDGEHMFNGSAGVSNHNGFSWGDGRSLPNHGATVEWDYVRIYEGEPPPFEPEASILFREKDGIDSWFKPSTNDITRNFEVPGIDHVAFNYAGHVYESQLSVPPGDYLDSRDTGNSNLVVRIDTEARGVIQKHTVGTFRHNSTTSTPNATDLFEVPIANDVGQALRDKIATVVGSPYVDTESLLGRTEFVRNPRYHKGSSGGFSCVGLIEWAAEQIGDQFPNEPLLHGSQGFVPDQWESIRANIRIPIGGGFGVPIGEVSIINTLSPNLLYHLLESRGRFTNTLAPVFQAVFDPVDFMITDPMGRRLGFTPQLGFINEIPGAFYNGDGDLEEVFIYDAVNGNYTVELFGKGEAVFAAVAGPENGFLVDDLIPIDGHLIFHVPVTTVPEPSSNLFVFSLIASLFVNKRRYPSRVVK
jgi:hypothetical protein